jgi:hypothetical protein
MINGLSDIFGSYFFTGTPDRNKYSKANLYRPGQAMNFAKF